MASESLDLKPIESKLQVLAQRANTIVVSDPVAYAEACEIAVEARNEIKAIHRVLDPGIDRLRKTLEAARAERDAYIARVDPIASMAATKAATWLAKKRLQDEEKERKANEERRAEAARKAEEERKALAAKAERDRAARQKEIEVARKAGEIKTREAERLKKQADENAAREKQRLAEQAAERVADVKPVHIKSSVPTVAGVRAHVNYGADVVDEDRLLAEFVRSSGTADRRQFLRRFVGVNAKEVSAYARETKDDAKVEGALPGVRAWHKDAV